MPFIQDHLAIRPERMNTAQSQWRQMTRIDTTGASASHVIEVLQAQHFDRLVYAEGDSWFDKFTPLPLTGTNLLQAIRTPYLTGVVDVSHIGDEARDMVRGWQKSRTEAMFKLFGFDAILLSAGGNDLKNLFAELFAVRAAQGAIAEADLTPFAIPSTYSAFFKEVVANIQRFIALRDAAKDARTREAPILLHGYDYLQPRDAGAMVLAGTRLGTGPWVYPALQAAGLSAAQMRSVADAVVDEMNRQYQQAFSGAGNVFVIDQRGLLTPAAPSARGDDADWLDEIHPNQSGFTKLARNRWDVPLARLLGWTPQPGDTMPALAAGNVSTAQGAPAGEGALA